MDLTFFPMVLAADLSGGLEEKALPGTTPVFACGCSCQCQGSFCARNFAVYCSDPILQPINNQACRDHAPEMNSVMRVNKVAAFFMACSGVIDAPSED